jgi:hypothetical protein
VALFYRESDYWQVEQNRCHGPNFISVELVTGKRRIFVVGAYIPPMDVSTLEYIGEALLSKPQRAELLLLGDLNANFQAPKDERDSDITPEMANFGLEDLVLRFRQRHNYLHGHTWRQRR